MDDQPRQGAPHEGVPVQSGGFPCIAAIRARPDTDGTRVSEVAVTGRDEQAVGIRRVERDVRYSDGSELVRAHGGPVLAGIGGLPQSP